MEFSKLLKQIRFDPNRDRLWLTGDLVNRGPDNLDTLRFIRGLGSSVVTVQGNHDLHLLAIVFGGHSIQSGDTFGDVLAADDCEELCRWMCKFPLIHIEAGYVLVHAGIPHIWSLSQAVRLAAEVQSTLCGTDSQKFLRNMYGNEPTLWTESLTGVDRLRTITNYLTRMRYVKWDGKLNFDHKLANDRCPIGYQAWFEYPAQFREQVVFGHWASLDGVTQRSQFQAIDTGCVWGRKLTALRIPDNQRFCVSAEATL